MNAIKISYKLFCGAEIELYKILDTVNGKREEIGLFELDDEDSREMYLEYIKRYKQFKGRKYLEKTIDWIFKELKPKRLTVLPLEKYRKYYESIGFKPYKQCNDDDIYYVKENNNG